VNSLDVFDWQAEDVWLPVDDALSGRVLAVREEQQLPALVTQPAPLEGQLIPSRPVYDPWPARLLGAGGCVALSGGGVWLAGEGIRAAGPYLLGLAFALGALAGLIALIKSNGSGGSGNSTITVEGSHHVTIRQ
jgi:hypothetical protein